VLPEEEDGEDIHAPGDDQRLIGIQPAQFIQQHIGRDQIDRLRHHHHAEEQVEEEIPTLKLHPAKGISRQERCDQHPYQR